MPQRAHGPHFGAPTLHTVSVPTRGIDQGQRLPRFLHARPVVSESVPDLFCRAVVMGALLMCFSFSDCPHPLTAFTYTPSCSRIMWRGFSLAAMISISVCGSSFSLSWSESTHGFFSHLAITETYSPASASSTDIFASLGFDLFISHVLTRTRARSLFFKNSFELTF